MANGLDIDGQALNGRWTALPSWAKLILLLGPTGAIACYLVFINAQTLPRMEQNQQLLLTAFERQADQLREVALQQKENHRLMVKLCVQQSKPERVDECFGP